MNNQRPTIVILISGSGSNLQAIIDAINEGYINADISAVISNQTDAFGLKRAQSENITTHIIKHTEFETREAFDTALMSCIDQYNPTLVVLAGFLRILSDKFVQHYLGKLLNIHPSLLPKYPGLNTHRQALQAGEQTHGASVHFVTEELDAGPIIIQVPVKVLEDDTEQRLAHRVLTHEHKVYPIAIKWFVEQRIKLSQNKVEFEGVMLNSPAQLDPVSGKVTINNKTWANT